METSPHNSTSHSTLPLNDQFDIMGNLPVMICVSGKDKLCFYFNECWLKFTGRTIEQEAGLGWTEMIHPEDLQTFLDFYSTNFDAQKEFKIEYRLKRFDGVYHWMLNNGAPRFDQDKNFAGFICTSVDIDNLKETEQRKDDFISAASHELKTPLTTMKVYAQVLEENLKKNDLEHGIEYVSQINKQIQKFSNLINDLLDLSNIQAKLLEYDKAPFKYEPLLRDVIGHFKNIATSVNVKIEGGTDKKIVGDKDRLAQVIINLLTNAIKYSKTEYDVIVKVELQDKFIKTSVIDWGIQIPKEYKTKIFEKFFRVNDKKNKTFPGLGIGLYFSAQIIKNHGGEIWLEDPKDNETTFSFTLPYSN